MRLPKDLTQVTSVSKVLTLILFITLPMLFFFIGMRYSQQLSTTPLVTITPVPLITYADSASPTKSDSSPTGAVKGIVTAYNTIPMLADGAPEIKIQTPDNSIIDLLFPTARNNCGLSADTLTEISRVKVGDLVEVFGTWIPNAQINICKGGSMKILNPRADQSLISFDIVEENYMRRIETKKSLFLNTAAEFNAFLNDNPSSVMPANNPEVDFTQYSVVIVAQGVKPSGGHSIGVEKLQEVNGKIIVYVKEQSPGESCPSSSVITYPYQIIQIKKVIKPVEFVSRAVTTVCE